MIRRMRIADCVCAALIFGVLLSWPSRAPGQDRPGESYDSLVRSYRRGNIEGTTSSVQRLFAAGPTGSAVPSELEPWTATQVRSGHHQDLAASLLLLSDGFFRSADSFGSADGFLEFPPSRRFAAAIALTHGALIEIASKPPPYPAKARSETLEFLRAWHLLWESYSQGHGWLPMRNWPDYLRRGLERFPQDTELLLAAGSREEMRWWFRPNNSQRREDGRADTKDGNLQSAAKWLRMSVEGRPVIVEAQLRLARVQYLMDDLDGAAATLGSAEGVAKDPVMRYLQRLFLGDVYKRQGNDGEAAKAFADAVAVVPVAQSARLAMARLAYVAGDRPAATSDVLRAFSTKDQGNDPWWWYTRGQWWAFDIYTAAAREMVRQ